MNYKNDSLFICIVSCSACVAVMSETNDKMRILVFWIVSAL